MKINKPILMSMALAGLTLVSLSTNALTITNDSNCVLTGPPAHLTYKPLSLTAYFMTSKPSSQGTQYSPTGISIAPGGSKTDVPTTNGHAIIVFTNEQGPGITNAYDDKPTCDSSGCAIISMPFGKDYMPALFPAGSVSMKNKTCTKT